MKVEYTLHVDFSFVDSQIRRNELGSMKHKSNYKLYDECLSWNTEEDAVRASSHFKCLSCGETITFSIEKDGYGTSLPALDTELSAHISLLEEAYHASGYEFIKECPAGHPNSLLIIFGETQPARYVLVRAGIANFRS